MGQKTRTYVNLLRVMCVCFIKVRINQNLLKMVYQTLLKNLQGQERQVERSEWKSGFSEYTESVLQLFLWNHIKTF